jgi:hypothetical protein
MHRHALVTVVPAGDLAPVPDYPPEPRSGPDAERAAPGSDAERSTPSPAGRRARRACPRCGASLGALSAAPDVDAESLYCGCCGLVVPAV